MEFNLILALEVIFKLFFFYLPVCKAGRYCIKSESKWEQVSIVAVLVRPWLRFEKRGGGNIWWHPVWNMVNSLYILSGFYLFWIALHFSLRLFFLVFYFIRGYRISLLTKKRILRYFLKLLSAALTTETQYKFKNIENCISKLSSKCHIHILHIRKQVNKFSLCC